MKRYCITLLCLFVTSFIVAQVNNTFNTTGDAVLGRPASGLYKLKLLGQTTERNGYLYFDGPNSTTVPSLLKLEANNTFTGGSVGHGAEMAFYTTSRTNATSTEAMRIDYSGKLGLGTATPLSNFHLYGVDPAGLGLQIQNGTGTGTRTLLTSYASKSSIETDKDFTIITNNNGSGGWTDKFIVTNAGNVGIGSATSPTVKFEVNGQNANFYSGTATNIVNFGRNSSESFSFQVTDLDGYLDYLQDDDANAAHVMYFRNLSAGTSASNDIRFQTSSLDRLSIKSNGNVGIGITSPLNLLDVNGVARFRRNGSATEGFVIGNDALTLQGWAGHNPYIEWKNVDNSRQGYMGWNTDRLSLLLENGYDFTVENANGGPKLMRVTSTGNVGIGTDSPGSSLSVYRDVNSSVSITSNQNTSDASLWFRINSTGKDGGIIYRNDGRLSFNLDGSAVVESNELMTIHPNGNVGIGVTTPDQKLTVKGIIHTNEVRVDVSAPIAPDYVFEPDYNLTPLAEIENYVKENKHLPEVPSAKQMGEEGMNLKEMNLLLLKKVEELTLHLIEQNKMLAEERQTNEVQAAEIAALKTAIKK
jgi:hypothetical protein